jgi:hypothetical protein
MLVSTRQNTGGSGPHSAKEPLPTLRAADSRVFGCSSRTSSPLPWASTPMIKPYEFTGTKIDIIRQTGNAVPVATASTLVRALFDH